MNDFIFQSPGWLYALPLILVLHLICRRGMNASAKAARVLGTHPLETQSALLFFSLALITLVVALSRPGWNPQPKLIAETGRDVILALDVSRSMLAEDRIPNRLENIRATSAQFVDDLPPGHQVALVLFAGSSHIVAPPSTDRQFVLKSLSEANTESAHFGGTRIGDVLRKIADGLLTNPERQGFQDIILLSDGEDHDSDPEGAIPLLNEAGASLILIGLGDPSRGTEIRLPDGSVIEHEGEPVRSRQDAELLRSLAEASDSGMYLNAGTRELDLGEVYQAFIRHRLGTATRETDFLEYQDRSGLLLNLALLLLGASAWTLHRKRRRYGNGIPIIVVFLCLLISADPAAAENPSDLESDFQTALDLAREGDLESAAERFSELTDDPLPGEIRAAALTNQATARIFQALDTAEPMDPSMQLSLLQEAVSSLESALNLDPDLQPAAHNLELARFRATLAQRAIEELAEQEMEDPEMETTVTDDALPGEADFMDEDWDADEWDEDADFSDTDPMAGDVELTDFLNETIPPPSETPQDILDQELQDERERLPPRRPRRNDIEKDW